MQRESQTNTRSFPIIALGKAIGKDALKDFLVRLFGKAQEKPKIRALRFLKKLGFRL